MDIALQDLYTLFYISRYIVSVRVTNVDNCITDDKVGHIILITKYVGTLPDFCGLIPFIVSRSVP